MLMTDSGESDIPSSSPGLPTPACLPDLSCPARPAGRSGGPPPCAGCGQPIQDEFILRVQGHLWHAQCLRCGVCHTLLSQSCYVRGTRVFCRVDFFRLFGASCARCSQVISPSEVVRRAHDNVYHVACFCCLGCGLAFNTGDEFYLRDDGRLLCKTDFRASRPSPAPDGQRGGVSGAGCPGKQERPAGSGATMSQQETEVLRQVYSTCKNPSRDLLQQISTGYGLDMRSVRAWFQSQRLRDRKQESHPGGTQANHVDMEGGRVCVGRVTAPPGSSPLPIVNDAMSVGRLPSGTRTDVTSLDSPFTMTSSYPRVVFPWPLPPEVWSGDFVPPNVDLDPCDLQDGEVRTTRCLPPTPASPPDLDFASRRGSDCGGQQQQQQQQPTARLEGGELAWINC